MAAPAPSSSNADRQRQIERTKTGILLLLVGALAGWIPVIGAVGSLLTLVGAIFVILGRAAFGPVHRRNVLASIVLFVSGISIAILGSLIVVGLAAGPVAAAKNEFELAAVLEEAFTNILFLAAVGAFVSGLAGVFFTYALQNQEGRVLLAGAYVITVIVQFVTLLAVLPVLADVARSIAHSAATGGSVDVGGIANTVSAAVARVQLLSAIPALLYAAANYLAWMRIKNGEIPEPGAAAVSGSMDSPSSLP